MTTVIIKDQSGSGRNTASITLEVGAERITLRDLITTRVREEVGGGNILMSPNDQYLCIVAARAGAAGAARAERLTRQASPACPASARSLPRWPPPR